REPATVIRSSTQLRLRIVVIDSGRCPDGRHREARDRDRRCGARKKHAAGGGERRPGGGIAPPARLGTVCTDPAPCTPTKLADGFGSKSLPVPDAAARDSPHCCWVLRSPSGRFGVRFFLSRRRLLNEGVPVKSALRRKRELSGNQ